MGFIDIDACTGIVARMRMTADDVMEAHALLTTSADHLDVDRSALANVWSDVMEVRRLADELQARVDLAIAIEAVRQRTSPGDCHNSVEIPDLPTRERVDEELGKVLALFVRDFDGEDAEQMAWLAGVLDAKSESAQFSGRFFEDLGPDQTMDLMTRIASANDREASDDQQTVMASLRGMLRTADASWTPGFRAEFSAGLVEMATGQRIVSHSRMSMCPAALAYLLAGGPYSTELLVGTARGLEEYEHSLVDEPVGPELLWEYRRRNGEPFREYYNASRDGFRGPAETWDPSVALMSALAKNPEAALAVFSRGADGDAVTPTLQHWLADRTWNADDFAALSDALAAATVDPRLMAKPEHDWNRAVITAATVNLIGGRSDISRQMILDADGGSIAASNFAAILSVNLLAADYATSDGYEADNAAGVDEKVLLWFSASEQMVMLPSFDAAPPGGDAASLSPLARFSVLASATQESTLSLRAAVDNYAMVKYATALGELGTSLNASGTILTTGNIETQLEGHPKDAFRGAWETQAKLEGMLTQAVGRSDIDDAKKNDARNALWVGAVTDTIGLIPYAKVLLKGVPEGFQRRALELGLKKTESGALSMLSTDEAAQAAKTAASTADVSLRRAQYQLSMALASADFVPTDLSSPLLTEDGEGVSYMEYKALDGSAYKNLTKPSTFASLANGDDFATNYQRSFFTYYPKD